MDPEGGLVEEEAMRDTLESRVPPKLFRDAHLIRMSVDM